MIDELRIVIGCAYVKIWNIQVFSLDFLLDHNVFNVWEALLFGLFKLYVSKLFVVFALHLTVFNIFRDVWNQDGNDDFETNDEMFDGDC